MYLNYTISDSLKKKIKKISRKDILLKKALYNKINEIINSNDKTILHYKFLRHDLKSRQRVHIKKHFVLVFKYLKEEKVIIFLDIDNHKNIYKEF